MREVNDAAGRVVAGAADDVLREFQRQGFEQAAVIGRMEAGSGRLRVEA